MNETLLRGWSQADKRIESIMRRATSGTIGIPLMEEMSSDQAKELSEHHFLRTKLGRIGISVDMTPEGEFIFDPGRQIIFRYKICSSSLRAWYVSTTTRDIICILHHRQ